jgi:hypothetical protein
MKEIDRAILEYLACGPAPKVEIVRKVSSVFFWFVRLRARWALARLEKRGLIHTKRMNTGRLKKAPPEYQITRLGFSILAGVRT